MNEMGWKKMVLLLRRRTKSALCEHPDERICCQRQLTRSNYAIPIHNLMEIQYADMSKIFMGIAKVEMTHLHMLREVIVLLDGKPVFTSGYPGQFWTSRTVAYGYALCAKLADDLKSEQRIIRQYEQHIAMVFYLAHFNSKVFLTS